MSSGITLVEIVVAGPQGVPGTPGSNTEPGGTTKQVLMKRSSVDYDVEWATTNSIDVIFASTSGLAATAVDTALDEINAKVTNNNANIVSLTNRAIAIELKTDNITVTKAINLDDLAVVCV